MEAAIQEMFTRTVEAEDYLGPADVSDVRGRDVHVKLPDGRRARAQLAFTFPYTPVAKDVLLVIGRAGRYYAIGVLCGNGRTDLALQGDVRALRHERNAHPEREPWDPPAVPEVDIATRGLRVVARDVMQKFESVIQRVSSILRVHAGESRTLVDGTSTLQAKRAPILTEETVSINGSEVHLG